MDKEFNIKAAAKNLKKKLASKNKRREKLFKKAETDCKEIIKMIIKKYNPERIYQWGSLLHPQNFSEISDIDIAVEGIDSVENYFQLLGDAMNMTDFSLDLVELEKIHPEHAQSIKTKGKLVYERKQ